MARATGVAIDRYDRIQPRKRDHARTGWLLSLVCAAALLTTSLGAAAQRVEGDRAAARGVYSAEVEVNDQGESERNVGFARGLAQVLGKLSGDSSAGSGSAVAKELRQAGKYVLGYDYRQDEGMSSRGAPSFETILVVRFDQEKIDALTAALGLPIWPQPRPKPVLWLAIDDGSGPRLVDLSRADAARSVLDRAQQRGYRLGLPNGTASEQALVGAIWRGDANVVARASARYSPPMQLVGKLYRNDGNWKVDWIFIDKGKVLSRWSESGANARQLMAIGADGAADALMKRYAKRSQTGPAGTYRVAFTGLDSADDYLRLVGYLQKLPVVRAVAPLRASAQQMEFNLELVSGLSGFELMVDGDGVLAGADLPADRSIPIPGDAGAIEGAPVEGPIQAPRSTAVYRLL